jgi:hypothetical protein
MHYIIATEKGVQLMTKEGQLDFDWALQQLGLEERKLVPASLHDVVENVVLFCDEAAQYDQEGFAFRIASDEDKFSMRIFGPFIITALNNSANDFFGLSDEQLQILQMKLTVQPMEQ